VNVGLLHPGAMGAAVGNALAAAGHTVHWASAGRSEATRARAAAFVDAGDVAGVLERCDVVFSVVPPHAALELARSLPPFDGIYVDANALAPATARAIGGAVSRFVDGGIIGAPTAPHLSLSGDDAPAVASLFAGTSVTARVVSNASALKCAYAAWTKGSAALLLATHAYARAEGIEDDLLAEWEPELHERLAQAERSAEAKGWRWTGEMEEIARAFAAVGLPAGFHEAAAAIYGVRAPRSP
jgi:3-hydroxyisobutyrate dehydrogenase-like beta-hydroxyacid dehydrogenase